MNDFELARPKTPQAAATMLAEQPTRALALAGGQDLLSLVKDGVLQPQRVVNLKGIDGLRSIEQRPDGGLRIGALVTLAELAQSKVVQQGWPILADAAGLAATPQIRNLGTAGGNLCQQPRCWYYRAAELHCARKGGEMCLAAAGEHRDHSIFPFGGCMAPSYSALATPLTALGGTVTAVGPQGERKLTLPELYAVLKDDVTRDTALQPGELLTQLDVPSAKGLEMAHEEVRYRASHDWPMATASVVLRREGGVVRAARVVLGAVAPVPWVSAPAAKALVGQPVNLGVASIAAKLALDEATSDEQLAYKVPLTQHLVRRVILSAAGVGDE